MPETHEHPRKFLDNWLRHATKDLCAEAKAQVDAEISAHFADAVAAGREAGLDEDDAAYQAYLALGDPQEARVNFQRVFLSVEQKQKLQALFTESSAKRKFADLAYCLLFFFILFAKWQDRSGPVSPYLVLLCGMTGMIFLASAVTVFFWRRLRPVWRFRLRIIRELSYGSGFWLSFLFPNADTRFPWMRYNHMFLALFFLVMPLLYYYFAWRKVRRHPEVLQ